MSVKTQKGRPKAAYALQAGASRHLHAGGVQRWAIGFTSRLSAPVKS